jgi:hypothetical protein
MRQNINKLYRIINKDNINRLDSINTIVYYIVVYCFAKEFGLPIELPLNLSSTSIDTINQQLNNMKYELTHKGLVNFNLETIDENRFTIITSLLKPSDFNIKTVVNDVYSYYLQNDTQLKIKDYEQHYNNPLLTKYIVDIVKPSSTDKIFDGNMKINSFLDYSIESMKKNKSTCDLNNLYGSCEDDTLRAMLNNMMYINSGTTTNFNKNILSSDILVNDIMITSDKPSTFDTIYFNCISNKHNIIHASCCSRVKQFKIRGTNYESLIIQLIMSSLNKNGKSIIVIPDSFLYSESNQVVETRKHLVENFNILKIIQLTDTVFNTKGNKYSIIYLENKMKTEKITVYSIDIKDNSVKESEYSYIDYNQVKLTNYSLYYKQYDNKLKINTVQKLKYVKLVDVVDIYSGSSFPDSIKAKPCSVLSINKYYNNNDSFKINTSDKIDNSCNLILVEKDNDNFIPRFILYYLDYLLKNKTQLYLTGKLNLIDINKIKTIEIPSIPKTSQSIVDSYYTSSNSIYNYNIEKINSYIELKKNLFTLLDYNNTINLDKIICIDTSTNLVEKYNNKTIPQLITINKNSMQAGTVQLLENVSINDTISSNMYYLTVEDKSISIQYIYYYLWYIEDKIKALAQLTAKPNLSISQLQSLAIPIIDKDVQENTAIYCDSFDKVISRIVVENNTIKDKDIMSIINRINHFI